jgi:uncharacterized protein YndB with AHSA1/START domain
MELKFQVQTKIQRPVAEVFDAVYSAEKLSKYFTNGGSSGSLIEGTTVEWGFADTPGQEMKFPVTVKQTIPNEMIVLEWQSRSDGGNTHVEMQFEEDGNSTIVRISESGWDESDADDLKRSYSNCMGWSQMLSALKAYLEYGINLRKGAYEGLYKSSDKNQSARGART